MCYLLNFCFLLFFFFFFNDTATTEIYTLSLHDALPICTGITTFRPSKWMIPRSVCGGAGSSICRSEEHTSELQSLRHLVCRLLLEKKKKKKNIACKTDDTRLTHQTKSYRDRTSLVQDKA